jgi:hypothetical protein
VALTNDYDEIDSDEGEDDSADDEAVEELTGDVTLNLSDLATATTVGVSAPRSV